MTSTRLIERPRITVVHLGNIGYHGGIHGERVAEKTRKYASAFRNVDFVGVDTRTFDPDSLNLPRDPNLRQVKADFTVGLNGLEDDSVHVISSDMAVGYYHPEGVPAVDYLTSLLNLSHRKLRLKAKFMASFGESRLALFRNALSRSPFQHSFEIRPFFPQEYQRTHWTRRVPKGKITYQLIAKKEIATSRRQ